MADHEKAKEKAKIDYEWRPSVGWYRVLRAFFGFLFHTLWPLRIRDSHYVPRTGAGVIVSNHLSLIDPFVVGYGAHRLVNFMGKAELFRVPVVGFIIRRLGGFPVDRSRRDVGTMRIALTVLKSGELLGMFPEGTRNTGGDLLEFRTGAARLAARTRVPIIPVAVHNTNKALPPGKWLRPARISIRFGEPFELTELYDTNDKGAAMEQALARIKEHVEALSE